MGQLQIWLFDEGELNIDQSFLQFNVYKNEFFLIWL